jgi:enoyl-CoA hydratase/carnithine racemase
MYAALAEALERAEGDPSIRLIRLAGDGQDFAAGNDLADFMTGLPRDLSDVPVWQMLRALAVCETPILAQVHGNCVGIGTTILLHCDLVVAEDSARFSLPFVDLGLVPEAASSLLLPRLAGRRRAARHLLLAEPFGVEEALDMGLVSHRAAVGELATRADAVAAVLLAKPAEALQVTQRLLRLNARAEVLERMEIESRLFGERLKSPEVAEAIAAFFAKRSTT